MLICHKTIHHKPSLIQDTKVRLAPVAVHALLDLRTGLGCGGSANTEDARSGAHCLPGHTDSDPSNARAAGI